MKHDSYCRFGSNCRKNQQGRCSYKHLKEQKSEKNEHTSTSKTYSRQRERSRSEERPKEQKKHKQYKSKHQKDKSRQQNPQRKPKYQEIESKKHAYLAKLDTKEKIQLKNTQEIKNNYQNKTIQSQKNKYSQNSKNKAVPIKNYQSQKHRQSQKHQSQQTNSKPYLCETRSSSIPFQKQFSKFCKSYHMHNICDNKDNCIKIHGFMFLGQEKIKRKVFMRSEKFTKDVKLWHSVHPQAIEYVIKNNKQIFFNQYRPDINQFKEISAFTIQNATNPKKQYFGGEATGVLFFSFINKDNLYDIVYENLVNHDSFSIKNAHHKEVTGVFHLSQQKIISVSLDGTLKVWKFDKTNFRLIQDNEITLVFKNLFNPQNKKFQLLFLYKTMLDDKELFLVGTSDSKLLIFGNQTPLSFKEIIISQKELKIVKVAKINKNNGPFQILILGYSKSRSIIYRLTINGADLELKEKIIEFTNMQEKRINTFELYQELIVVSYSNQVILYSIKKEVKAIGGIIHQNPIQQIAIAQYQLKSTALKFTMMAVLQGASCNAKQDGLLSIYLIK